MPELSQDLFARLFVESREALARYVRRFVRSEEAAENIVQEAFARTFEKGRSAPQPRAFLFLTARNLLVDNKRQESARAEESMEEHEAAHFVDTGAPQDEKLIADEASRIIKQAIELLPPQQHASVTLRLLHGHSYKEIAGILGISSKTVEKHVHNGFMRVHEYVRARYSGGRDG